MGIEPMASSLPRTCSTTELQGRGALVYGAGGSGPGCARGRRPSPRPRPLFSALKVGVSAWQFGQSKTRLSGELLRQSPSSCSKSSGTRFVEG